MTGVSQLCPPHRWLLDSGLGLTTGGTCTMCGARKEGFVNWPDNDLGFNAAVLRQKARRGGQAKMKGAS